MKPSFQFFKSIDKPLSRPALVLALTLLASVGSVWAQEVTRVYPPYVVNGQETNFTVEGRYFTSKDPEALGLRHSFPKPADCNQARRTRPATATRYYFSCRFSSSSDTARLIILHKPKAKPTVRLWEGSLQVLAAPPDVRGVAIVSEPRDGTSHIDCDASQRCTTVVGGVAGQLLQIEVHGNHLPGSLRLESGLCTDGMRVVQQSLNMHVLECKAPNAGEHPLVVLSAPRDESGAELMSTRISLRADSKSP